MWSGCGLTTDRVCAFAAAACLCRRPSLQPMSQSHLIAQLHSMHDPTNNGATLRPFQTFQHCRCQNPPSWPDITQNIMQNRHIEAPSPPSFAVVAGPRAFATGHVFVGARRRPSQPI
ncbi:predicted protein [Plenodomus lingam JN3]|uniref:Predicted protein n=1 Tax=Leptosphaeria maculans (strain JN3 / isolate v23.1.3 / race Av1-4-5-6-7-8) TaxID=985895 RepID=E5A8N0_LEPMJ|nr:predicted protein [Plenodomus lingam JN3]CBX99975.1 predicted protein [Plenodomus lingam JN3]